MLCDPYILAQCQARGINQKWLLHLGSGTLPLHFPTSRTPSTGRKPEVATSHVRSWGPRTGRMWYVTPAFSGPPNAKRGEKIRVGYRTPAFSGAKRRAEVLRNPCILGGPKPQARGYNENCYLTLTFSGAHNRAEVLHNPCILGGRQRQVWGENKKWRPHPYLLGGLEEGRSAMEPLHSRDSPTPSAGSKSEVAT